MTYLFDHDAAHGILRLRYIGRVSDESIKEAYKATPQAVLKTNPRGMIIDLSEVTIFDVSTQTIHELAAYQPTVKDPSVPRIIVAPTPYLFGMSRMFQILGEHKRPMLQVMGSAEEAYAQLEMEQPEFRPLRE
ncbi:MAG TPA: hypothetical protein VLK33_03900 [Terriglobales bacterium]|nr:hypothetical protein [Terriglobales bacterium]